MSSIATSHNWAQLLRLGVCSASLAALAYCAWRHHQQQQQQASFLEMVRSFLSSTRAAAKRTVRDTLDNIDTGLEELVSTLKEKYVSEEAQEMLDNIQQLIDHVKNYDMEGKPYHGSLFVLLAILKNVQTMAEFDSWERSLPNISDIPLHLAEKIQHASFFAFSVYDAAKFAEDDTDNVAETMGVSAGEVLAVELRDDEGEGVCPKFVLLVDYSARALVLTVRGTSSLRDALLDMVCEDAPFLAGFAHAGILTGARKVWSLVGDAVISACKQHPEYELLVTGHSLGAGVAVLLTLELLLGAAAASLPANTAVRCLAFAPPPVFRPDNDAEWPQEMVRERIVMVINNHDCIPRTSLGSLTRLVTSLRAVDEMNLSFRQQLQLVRGAAEEDEEAAGLVARVEAAVREAAQDRFPYLQHPGTLVYLKREGEGGRCVALGEASVRGELGTPRHLFLLADMVSDHTRLSYKHALESLL